MNEEIIVCRCMNVTADDIIKTYKAGYPNISFSEVKTQFKIGARCKCCTTADCPITDANADDVLLALHNTLEK